MERIPTGRRQTSWLVTRMTEGQTEKGITQNDQLVARAGFEPGMTTLKPSARRNHSTITLPTHGEQ